MPEFTIPLVGEETRRGLGFSASGTKDQYFGGCVFTRMSNDATQSGNWYIEKRPGIGVDGTASAGNVGTAILVSPSTSHVITAFGGSNSTIFDNITSAGTITGVCVHIIETQFSGVTYYLMTSSDGTGWYLVNGAISDTSFTGDTHSNTTIDNITGASGVYVGQAISGTNIQAGTRVASRSPDTDTPTSITTTLATTGTTGGVTITKTPVAKIISANFPSVVGGFAVMDGYAFVITSIGRVYNSNVNDINTWSAQNYISADIATDQGVDIVKYNNHIIAFGSTSTEYFYNSGNSAGSILSSRKELFKNIGAYPASATSRVVTTINDSVFWIGNDFCLYTFDGLEPKKLSVQGMKMGTTTFTPNIMSAFRVGVDTIVHISTTGSSTDDKWYSLYTNSWFEPNLGVTTLSIANLSNPTSTIVAEAVSGTSTSGNVYTISTSLYQDDSSPFTMTVQTEPYYLNNGLPFEIDNITLIADTQSSGSVLLESTANDYGSLGTIGTFLLTDQQKNLSGGGYYDSSVAFKLTDSGNNPNRMQALKLIWRPAQ